jgi:hypothetical protein
MGDDLRRSKLQLAIGNQPKKIDAVLAGRKIETGSLKFCE